jgi:hypothetical protein
VFLQRVRKPLKRWEIPGFARERESCLSGEERFAGFLKQLHVLSGENRAGTGRGIEFSDGVPDGARNAREKIQFLERHRVPDRDGKVAEDGPQYRYRVLSGKGFGVKGMSRDATGITVLMERIVEKESPLTKPEEAAEQH